MIEVRSNPSDKCKLLVNGIRGEVDSPAKADATIFSPPQRASALGADKLGRELLIDFGQPLWIEIAISHHFVYGPEIGLVAARDGPLKQPGGRRANVLERMRFAARSKNEIAGDNPAFLAIAERSAALSAYS